MATHKTQVPESELMPGQDTLCYSKCCEAQGPPELLTLGALTQITLTVLILVLTRDDLSNVD